MKHVVCDKCKATEAFTASNSVDTVPAGWTRIRAHENYRPDAVLMELCPACTDAMIGFVRGEKTTAELDADLTALERRMLTADAATDAKALDPMLADMEALPRNPVEYVGSHDDLQPVRTDRDFGGGC